MKIFLLVLIAVLCGSLRESTQSSLTSHASASHKVSITFIATVKSIEMLGERELKVIPVDFDSRFAVTVHIESVTPKDVPLEADTDQNFGIHSPAQLFPDTKEEAIGKNYRFKAVWNGMGTNSKFYNLTAVSIAHEPTTAGGN
jgi:hypothetical protein